MSDAVQRLQGVSEGCAGCEHSQAPSFQPGAACQRLGRVAAALPHPKCGGRSLVEQLPYALLTQFSPAYWERLSNA